MTIAEERMRLAESASQPQPGAEMFRNTIVALVSVAIASHSLAAQRTGEWYRPTGSACSSVDMSAAKSVTIKTNLYNASTMIAPDSAKLIALCAVPGQIGSGEMNRRDGRTEYAIDIIPNKKKTHAKVIVDARTGAVLSSKQFGGLRGIAGWVRESAEHKKNDKP